MEGLPARLTDVRDRIARAAARAGRDPSRIRLVAVSKTFDAARIRAAAAAGQVHFGENKLQEAQQKKPGTSDLSIVWHLIGHLQSNKARKAAAEFDVIHSVDDASLVRRLDSAASEAGRSLELLVQVDLAHEPTKHGASEEQLPAIFESAHRCRSVHLTGLMMLPPASEDPEGSRPWFRELQAVRERLLARGVDSAMLGELSIGMSHDYEVAVEEGATLVRVGSAIFGSRPAA